MGKNYWRIWLGLTLCRSTSISPAPIHLERRAGLRQRNLCPKWLASEEAQTRSWDRLASPGLQGKRT